MLDRVFLTVLNMSLTASFVIVAVLLARLVLRRAPKVISYALWAVVLFNLVSPYKPESVFSLMPFRPEPISEAALVIDADISFTEAAVYSMDFPMEDRLIPLNADKIDTSYNAYGEDVTHRYLFGYQAYVKLGSYLWPIGAASLVAYAIIKYIGLKRRVSLAIRVDGNIYESDRIDSPFVLGLVRPRIYIPIGMEHGQNAHILEHERTHIRRRDYIVSVIAFAALALHWFNPLVWVAYILMLRDMESSCDEAVLRKSAEDIRCEYSSALAGFSHNKRRLSFPLAFGEQSVKERVKNVLNFKTPSKLFISAAVVLALVLSVGFAVNRASNEPLIEMQMVYEKHPAYFFSQMKLIWDDTVYHVTAMNNTGRGREIGYATDEYGTWRIFELRGHGRDYLLAVESEDVWRVMSVHPPKEPWRQYILEGITDELQSLYTRSISLYDDGTAVISESPLSSFMLAGMYYYDFSDGELLITQGDGSVIARFGVIDDNAIEFKEAFIPLRAQSGARYVTAGFDGYYSGEGNADADLSADTSAGSSADTSANPSADLIPGQSQEQSPELSHNSLPSAEPDYDEAVASLMGRLAYDMWEPYVSLVPFEIPGYVEDNAATRLAMRWPEFQLAEIGVRPGNRLIAIDSIETAIQTGQVPSDGLLTVSGTSEIRYTRSEPSVNGVNVLFHLIIDVTGEDLRIVAIDMVFDSRYRSMKEEIETLSGGGTPSVQVIDSVVDAAIGGVRGS